MPKLNHLLVVFLSICCLRTAQAQESILPVRLYGDIRVRGELDMRDFDQRTPGNAYTLLRSRMGVEAKPLENVRVVFQVQDSRVFGQERDGTGAFNTLADSKNIDLHQGFVELKRLLAGIITLRLGRQELGYGNERLIGAVGWHNVGRVFDGGLIRFEPVNFTIDVFAMNLAEVQSYAAVATPAAVQSVRDAGSDLYGVYGTARQIRNNVLEGYVLYQSDRNQTVPGSNDLSRWTLGGHLKGHLPLLEYEGEAAYQTGSRRGLDVSAYLLTGSLDLRLDEQARSKIGAGCDLLSGTPTASGMYKSFDPMFHTGHKFYGFMDYFINVPASTGNRGLVDLFARASFAFSDAIRSGIWVHHFRTHTDPRNLGQEIDCTLSYRMNQAVTFSGGMCAFLPGDVMSIRFNASSTGLWGFLVTSVSF